MIPFPASTWAMIAGIRDALEGTAKQVDPRLASLLRSLARRLYAARLLAGRMTKP